MRNCCLLTCEHASNDIPLAFRSLWSSELVHSHRGFDLGAVTYAQMLSRAFECPIFLGKVSRLLIDLNRSLLHPSMRTCPKWLIQKYWLPFHTTVLQQIVQFRNQHCFVYHFSCHSFTPELHGKVRMCDVGVLYDPARPMELACAREIVRVLRRDTTLRILCNYPYRGTSDGHTSSLRKRFLDEEYSGIELEVNQAIIDTPYWKKVGMPALIRALTAGMKI